MILVSFFIDAVFVNKTFLDDKRSLKDLNDFESVVETLTRIIAISEIRVLIILIMRDCFE